MSKIKRIVIITSVIIVGFIIFSLIFPNPITSFLFTHNDDSLSPYEQGVNNINQEDVKIYLYGDDIDFSNDIKINKVNSIEPILFGYLIINDRNSNLSFSDEDYKTILENINFGITVIYLGDHQFSNFAQHNIMKEIDKDEVKDNGLFGVLINKTGRHSGFWTKESEDIMTRKNHFLAEIIVSEIVDGIKL